MILYEGPSLLDGSPIVAIATHTSTNRKTGPMVQTWILRMDCSPTEASKRGIDGAICGDCPQRHSLGGGCYVNLGHAPSGVYRAFTRGKYDSDQPYCQAVDRTLRLGAEVRLGAYGDPAAVPTEVWQRTIRNARRWTGYTHQWRTALDLRGLVMASVDTPEEAAEATRLGWRYFRGVSASAPDVGNLPREIECPADSRGVQCIDCTLCDGARDNDRRKSIAIRVHGASATRYSSRLAVMQ